MAVAHDFAKWGPRVLYRWGDGLDWANSLLSAPVSSTSEDKSNNGASVAALSMGEERLRVIIEDDDAGTAKSIDREIAEFKRRTEGKLAEAARARAEVQRVRMKSLGWRATAARAISTGNPWTMTMNLHPCDLKVSRRTENSDPAYEI